MTDQTNVVASADIVIPAPDPDSELAQILAALVTVLDDVAQNAAKSASERHATELAALRPLAGNPVIAKALLELERESELDRENAANHARFITRKQYAEVFAVIDAWGRPVAPANGKPSGKTSSKSASGDKPIVDLDGNVYSKIQTPRAAYVPSGKSPCGACPISQHVIPRAPATAGDDAMKSANFRQQSTERLAQMSRADVVAHADCFAALTDAEFSYPHLATVNSYVVNS
jgi:hypothetical protein